MSIQRLSDHVAELMSVVHDLQEWLDSFPHKDNEDWWIASLCYSWNTEAVFIGNICVWDDQNSCVDEDNGQTLLDYCKQEWLKHCRTHEAFL